MTCFSANSHGLTIDQILDMVIADTDVNPTDGVISLDEFKMELLGRWDTNPGEWLHDIKCLVCYKLINHISSNVLK